ncbi:MAG: hypothetical protein CSYNP_04508 [Syntrophus sp. SKADARSKE-3]|nr:hypothetical protein [Syntrophus sp. SKADARSKE-3]
MSGEGIDASRDHSASADLNRRIPVTRSAYTPYLLGLIGLFIVQILIGTLLTPDRIIRISGAAPPALSVRIGYGLGWVAFLLIPFPLAVSILSLLFKSRRNLSSFFKIFFWTTLGTFLMSVILQISYVPGIIQ